MGPFLSEAPRPKRFRASPGGSAAIWRLCAGKLFGSATGFIPPSMASYIRARWNKRKASGFREGNQEEAVLIERWETFREVPALMEMPDLLKRMDRRILM